MLDWLHDRPADPKESISTVQDVDKDGIKYVSHDNTESNWVAPDGPPRVPDPTSNCSILSNRRGRRRVFCPGSGGRIQAKSKPLKKSGSSRNPALQEKYIVRMQGKSMSRARIVHPETRHCSASQALSSRDRTTCPGRQC